MKPDLSVTLEAGSLLIIETGIYSDKQWNGPVRLLKTVTKQELVDQFNASPVHRELGDDWKDAHEPGDFLPWLIANGFVEHVDVHAWHVGYSSRFEP